MDATKYIGEVLPDGHLSLPEETAKQVGKVFEVILLPAQQNGIYTFSETLAKEKGILHYTEEDIERIIHESRGLAG